RGRGGGELGVAEGLAERGGERDAIGQVDARQVDGVCAAPRHVGDERRVARPESDVVADAAEMHRERRPPASGAEDRDRARHARTPRRRSVPVRMRPTLPRWRNTMISDAADAAITAGAELPSIYASGGSAMDARTDPREMYFVSQTATAKIASAGASASGVSIEKTPQAVATPLPPRNPSQTG